MNGSSSDATEGPSLLSRHWVRLRTIGVMPSMNAAPWLSGAGPLVNGSAQWLLGSLPNRIRPATGTRGWIADFQFIPRQRDGTFRVRSRLVREHAALDAHDKGLAPLIDRPGAELGSGSLHHRLIFFRCALLAVVDFELGNIGSHVDLSVSSTGVEDQDAFRIGSIELPLGAVRGDVIIGDERPGSGELLLERLLLGKGAPRQQGKSERRDYRKTENVTSFHFASPCSFIDAA